MFFFPCLFWFSQLTIGARVHKIFWDSKDVFEPIPGHEIQSHVFADGGREAEDNAVLHSEMWYVVVLRRAT